MRLFKSFSLREVVPIDSTVHESYILRCLQNAVKTKDASYLNSALMSISISLQLHNITICTEMLLDVLTDILHSKCNNDVIYSQLQNIDDTLDGDQNGATGFSLCVFQSASLQLKKKEI